MEQKEKEILKRQIASAMAALESAGSVLEAVFIALEYPEKELAEEKKECSHPKDRRENMSTMGWKRWRCLECGHIEEVKLSG